VVRWTAYLKQKQKRIDKDQAEINKALGLPSSLLPPNAGTVIREVKATKHLGSSLSPVSANAHGPLGFVSNDAPAIVVPAR
jgi:hypothetical protein